MLSFISEKETPKSRKREIKGKHKKHKKALKYSFTVNLLYKNKPKINIKNTTKNSSFEEREKPVKREARYK